MQGLVTKVVVILLSLLLVIIYQRLTSSHIIEHYSVLSA